MKTERIFEAIETASGLIARLDARISATPWAEAWHIRSTFYAAEKLAAVDGTPTQSGDIVRLMCERTKNTASDTPRQFT